MAAPALACTPARMVPGTMQPVGTCGMAYHDEAYMTRSLSAAEDYGEGVVVQYYFEGNACRGNMSMIVLDCMAGEAAIFGPGAPEGPTQPAPKGDVWKQLEDQILRGARAGRAMSVSEITAHARGAGFINAATVTVPGRYGISNDAQIPKHSFDLGCGCRAFYPASPGAGS